MQTIPGFDGTPLAVHRVGEGRPVLMLHGLFSSAEMNWIRFGHAAKLADAGFEAIMPDLRVHGESGAPHDPDAYPTDVLVKDVLHIAQELELDDFDLVGFSLGARTSTEGVIAGLKPRRLVLAGMGLESLDNWTRRSGFFVDMIDRYDTIERGDPAFMAKAFMKTMGIDRVAARLLLHSVSHIDNAELDALSMPTLVLCGREDRDNGSPQALADALPDATLVEIPGNHMQSVTKPEMGDALVEFLTA